MKFIVFVLLVMAMPLFAQDTLVSKNAPILHQIEVSAKVWSGIIAEREADLREIEGMAEDRSDAGKYTVDLSGKKVKIRSKQEIVDKYKRALRSSIDRRNQEIGELVAQLK